MIDMILRPAYGKVYPNKEAAKADWENGVDFRMLGTSTYASIRDIKRLKMLAINVVIFVPGSGSIVIS